MARAPYTDFPQLLASTVRNLVGAVLACSIACILGGAIPCFAAEPRYESIPICIFAWVFHLALAGIAFWGVAFVLIQVWCIHELVQGTGYPLRIVLISFLAQLTLSCIVTAVFLSDVYTNDLPLRMIAVWMLFGIPVGIYVLRSFQERTEEVAG